MSPRGHLPVYIVDVSLDNDQVAGDHDGQNVSRVPAEEEEEENTHAVTLI